MTRRRLTVELDEETVRDLAALGEDPSEMLAILAHAAAEGVRRPDHPRRGQTDASLRAERARSDEELVEARRSGEAAREHDRAERTRPAARLGSVERDATDEDLLVERAQVDRALGDQREANAAMVGATIRAQELTAEADVAKDHAEETGRQLRRVAEFREMFIGILGHDLRTPLGSIVMAASVMLERGHLDPPDATMAARIVRSSERMTRMIAQLLDLTRTRLGDGLPLEPQPTDLREVCRDVVDEFEATVELEMEGDLTGTWDHDRLEELLSNLAGNAIEHAAPGTAVVVKAHPEGEQVVIAVRNQGECIPADVLPYIFAPFHRAKQAEKSATGNLGLGLYIADQIVLAHGGTLSVRSADDETTFEIRLPRSPPADPAG